MRTKSAPNDGHVQSAVDGKLHVLLGGGRHLQAERAEQTSFDSDWELEFVESLRFELQVSEFEVSLKDRDAERLEVKPFDILAQILVQIVQNLCLKHLVRCL